MSRVVPPLDVEPGDVEGWVESAGGLFEEGYRYLRTVGFRPGPCFVGAWLSVGRDDRGELGTMQAVADWLGVSRMTVYRWRNRHRLDEWAEQLRLQALRGDRLGEVDRVTFEQAVDPEAPVAARKLYYERAGVLRQTVEVQEKTREQVLQDWLAELRDAEEERPEDGA